MTGPTDEPNVIYDLDTDTHVAVITLNRPYAGNSLNDATRKELFEAWARYDSDDNARVAVLTGAGNRFFCTGADLKEMAAKAEKVPPAGRAPMPNENVALAKPVIAAVNGAAYGGGFQMAQLADMCYAADTATFAVPEARRGRGAPWAAPLMWGIPRRYMFEVIAVGQPLTAQRAWDMGLVNGVVPAADLMKHCLAIARQIAANAPLSVRAAKCMVQDIHVAAGLDVAKQMSARVWKPVYESEDAIEGPRAFREKREPAWRGR
jgi:enoyl-CoA hydratase/carnithine racemase